MPALALILVPLFALLALAFVFRDNIGAKVIAIYFGIYLLSGLLIFLFKLAIPLLGAVGASLVIVLFFHAKLRRFM